MDLEFHTRVAEAVRDMAADTSVGHTVERAVAMCVDALPHCDMAGASLVTHGRIDTLAASHEDLREVDALQFHLRQGPCFDALRTHQVVTSLDLAHDRRWPGWGPQLSTRTGMHSSMSFRLFTSAGSLGALNIYAGGVDAFGSEELLAGQVLAAMTAVSVAASAKESQLEQALDSRTVIAQATGMLMERFGLDSETAFSVIRRISQDHNLKVHALAEELVRTGALPAQRRGQH